jgi:cell division protein FtsI/penicillin-binding protein 2
VSIVVYNPQNGHVKAMVNAPTYDPNSFDDAYTLMPLGPELGYVVDDTTHIDFRAIADGKKQEWYAYMDAETSRIL